MFCNFIDIGNQVLPAIAYLRDEAINSSEIEKRGGAQESIRRGFLKKL